MSCFDAAEPAPDGFAMQCGDATSVAIAGDLIANAIIADSGGTANVMMVNIPDFTVLAVERDAAARRRTRRTARTARSPNWR